MNWQILPSKRGWRVWSCHRGVNVVNDVTWEKAFTIKQHLEANAPTRSDSMKGGA